MAVEEITGRVPLILRCRIEREPTVIEAPDNADEWMVQVIAHAVDELPPRSFGRERLAGAGCSQTCEDGVHGAGLV